MADKGTSKTVGIKQRGGSQLNDLLMERLMEEPNYVSDEGKVKKWVVAEEARNYSPVLLALLLKDEKLRKTFFTEVVGATVFKLDTFLQFMEQKNFLSDSYTRYTQKIGLQIGGRFMNQRNEVELVFPYKDCILEGGQTKEDQKCNEIFFNQTLAQDEITQLLEPKVLTNAVRYDADGEHPVGIIQSNDNLIIKGNNLLALSSLKRKLYGKVKLIYIDPPYYFVTQKNEDTFAYNSNFKLSTWLTFLKNRLELAREMLSEDGAIFVQISDDGVGELHILLKEVFNRNGENNFINKITVRTKSPSGFASVNPGVFETAEYILAFAKNKKKWTYNRQYVESCYDPNYSKIITNYGQDYHHWEVEDLGDYIAKERGYVDKREAIAKMGKALFEETIGGDALKYADRVFRLTAIGNNAGADVIRIKKLSSENPDEIYRISRDDHYDVYITKGQEIAFYQKKIRNIDGQMVPTMLLSNIWTDISYEGIAQEGSVQLKGGKKPERLIRRIIDMATNEGDMVLDFFSGTGTTAAVALKMKRKFVVMEQLESQIEKTLKRMESVVKGDNNPLSRILNWRGGGSFVYLELKRYNQLFIDEIEKAQTTGELIAIWEQMKARAFFRFNVEMQKIDDDMEGFKALTLEEQKQMLCSLLDMNQLYVNCSDMDDAEAGVTEEEKRITKTFYGEE